MDEGYIKFNCHWTKSAALATEKIQAINQCRNQLYQLGFIGAYDNGIGFGNISQRLENNTFLISGSTTGNFPHLNGAHYAIVKSFDIDKNEVKCIGPIKASSESMSHAVIFQTCPEIQVVIHIHHLQLWKNTLHKIPTTAKTAAYGTPEMAIEIIRLLTESSVRNEEKIFNMAGHEEGLIVFGNNFEEAMDILLQCANRFL